MPCKRLKEFLDQHRVKYQTLRHSPAYTAQEVAAATHISGKQVAKTVIVRLDGELAMAVLPASYRVDLARLSQATGKRAGLASEMDFLQAFPGCELGAMPPFGRLWGIDVYVAESLAEDYTIAFLAGTHGEVIIMAFDDYRALAEPRILKFSRRS